MRRPCFACLSQETPEDRAWREARAVSNALSEKVQKLNAQLMRLHVRQQEAWEAEHAAFGAVVERLQPGWTAAQAEAARARA